MKKLAFFMIVVCSQFFFAQTCTVPDREAFAKKVKAFKEAVNPAMTNNKMVGMIGRSFLKTPYVAHTLETDGEEQLVVNFLQLDCTTFLETTFSLTRTVMQEDTSFDRYCKNLTELRYRRGKINGYPSRLHYFSDWLYNNVEKGLIEDITKEIGGEPITFSVGFMSTHPESYKMLKSNLEFIKDIQLQEAEINKRQYYYVPKGKVSSIESKISEGDFIAITTNLKGLDIGHVGIAVKENGVTKFLHAPMVDSEVQITKESLSEYLKKVKKHTGIIVFKMK